MTEENSVHLFRVLSASLSSLTTFRLDVKVNQEKGGKKGSQKDGKVGAECNLERKGLCGEGFNNGVKSKGRGGNSGNRNGSDSSLLEVKARLHNSLGNWMSEVLKGRRKVHKRRLESHIAN